MYDAQYGARGAHWSDANEDFPPTVLIISPHVHHDIPSRAS